MPHSLPLLLTQPPQPQGQLQAKSQEPKPDAPKPSLPLAPPPSPTASCFGLTLPVLLNPFLPCPHYARVASMHSGESHSDSSREDRHVVGTAWEGSMGYRVEGGKEGWPGPGTRQLALRLQGTELFPVISLGALTLWGSASVGPLCAWSPALRPAGLCQAASMCPDLLLLDRSGDWISVEMSGVLLSDGDRVLRLGQNRGL